MHDLSLVQYAVIAATAFIASLLGGLTGYGTGLLLPPVLAPMLGPEAVVPVISVSALISNTSRLVAFRKEFDYRRAAIVSACAAPTCALAAYGYTLLSGPGVAILLGAVLIVLVPVRRTVARMRRGHLGDAGLACAGAAYGFVVGGTAGTGILLLSILLAAGLNGPAVIATDSAISLLIGIVKAGIFQAAGTLTTGLWIIALLIGAAAIPGAFIARNLAYRLTARSHANILDAVIIAGGLVLILQGIGVGR